MDRFSYHLFKFSEENQLIEKGDKILVSISGGVDSTSLFRLLHAFREKIDMQLHLVHFHHGLRKESDEEERFISALADRYTTPLSVIKATHLKGASGMQNSAREWRYRHLNQVMRQLDYRKIALGHHLDDLIETQIWRMLRGGSLFAFNPMQVLSLPYIRPLLNTRKEELTAYLRKIGQDWTEDMSNQADDYTRNMIRNQILPLMKDCAGGRLAEKLLALNDDATQLKYFFNDLVPTHKYQQKELSFRMISELNPIFAKELIHQYLIYNNQLEITRASINRIYELVTGNRGGWLVCLKNGISVLGKSKKISLVKHD